MTRFLYAFLCLLLIAWAAIAQSPTYTVTNKAQRFTVINKAEKPDGPWNNPSCSCEGFPATTPCPCSQFKGGCKAHCFPFGNGALPNSGVIQQQAPVTVCQNGVCGVVSAPSQFSSCANGSCSGGSCSSPASSGGWYPGKLLGRRR